MQNSTVTRGSDFLTYSPLLLLSISPYLSASLSWIKLISKETARIEKGGRRMELRGTEKILALDIFTSHLG